MRYDIGKEKCKTCPQDELNSMWYVTIDGRRFGHVVRKENLSAVMAWARTSIDELSNYAVSKHQKRMESHVKR